MSLSIGIVGLPNVGKSTLFNALTNNEVLAANYPFATIEPNTGMVPIPEGRLAELSKLYNNAPVKPATVQFVDIAGLVKGASEGEGLGNQFLSNIRSTNAIAHVVRAFDDPNVQHVTAMLNPKSDIETINTELILADIQSLENRLQKLKKEAKANPKLKNELTTLEQAISFLNAGIVLNEAVADWEHDTIEWLKKNLQPLTLKPVIYVFNVDENDLTNKEKQLKLQQLVHPAKAIFVCAKLEQELQSLDQQDRTELLSSYDVDSSGLEQLISSAYDVLDLQSYLTAGEKEVRAWTIPKLTTAPQAAGVIHSDLERGFIAAQIVNFDDLVAAGSIHAAKAGGKVRTEGRDYTMRPGDVAEFRFNVSK